MIALLVIGLIDTIKGKFVIDLDKIYTVSAFSNRKLMFDEIKGYRVNDKFILVESNFADKKNIKISTYFEKTNEIIDWLDLRYPNLTFFDIEQEEQDILDNQELGWSIEERAKKIKNARKTASILNWTGSSIAIASVFWVDYYEYKILGSILIPIIATIAFVYFKGLLRIDEKDGSAYPTLFFAFFSPILALIWRALFDYNLYSNESIWIPSLLITVIILSILMVGNQEFKLKKTESYIVILSFTTLIFGYSYSAIKLLNCFYDKSSPEVFKAQILNKREDSDKTTTYYFELAPWGQRKEIEEVSVSKDLYNQLQKNDKVNVYYQKGLFNIPWFFTAK